ncbi:pyruvate dehydrogenase complex dihydrolipoamide acetyltransferase [Gluconobacter japonicus]|uniref:Acetyltransferase component of pyruvate dehydrogenase complex n=1 Tax=Gluconobacter japonicus TaxID=376620 RepID=A0ABQ5WG71_GLUJA|nr:pyruvate dehydrogenase complex dihydrolipoamide acetyltransferase [Gluconobacter japonicus]KXV26386.1 branched-chain alpha-keto acid dehydrogenase subunit E2 [Gluconobacter japonicus]GBR27092.1 dihydrolipoamide acetyltransferase component [Gluconobacter japonicus NBRC 3271]GLQ59121.1 acetyltransferase component of pyruvate dehydrogenase complex [Gluconobacter japonicus]
MATDILMPALSPTMTEGKLARWLKKEGDKVSAGDVIAEIETDKATMEVEAVDEGILGRILVQEGVEGVAVNTPIAILVEEGEDVPDASTAQTPAVALAAEPVAASIPPASTKAAPKDESSERIFVSPLAKRMAKDRGIALGSLNGTGPNGRILKRDVEKGGNAAPVAPKTTPATPVATDGDVKRVPNSTMRKVIARRLTESKTQVPHFYVSVDIELDALLALRSKLNATAEDNSFKISVNDMMIKAVGLALKKQPGLNVQFTDAETLHFENVDISMAVSIPEGLITPIIRNADQKSLREISREAKDLAKRARAGKLKPEEFQGGTFSISNMGMFGVRDFAAIINPPQAGILAIASGEKRAVVRGDQLAIATVMTATLSVDHRAVDGALGAQWLNALRDIVQNPYTLVV